MKKLSHYDRAGSVRMVDVSAKAESRRTARAHAFVRIARAVLKKLPENPKGNPLEIARIAGIAAAKRTWELIPLCHPLMLTHADVEVTRRKDRRADRGECSYHRADRRRDGSAHRGFGSRTHRI